MFFSHGQILTDLFHSSLFIYTGYTYLSKQELAFSTYTPEKSIKATGETMMFMTIWEPTAVCQITEEPHQSYFNFHSGHSGHRSLKKIKNTVSAHTVDIVHTSFLILSTRVCKNLSLFLIQENSSNISRFLQCYVICLWQLLKPTIFIVHI